VCKATEYIVLPTLYEMQTENLKGIYIELISCTFCNDGDDLRNEEDVKDRDKDVNDPMDLDDELDLNDGD